MERKAALSKAPRRGAPKKVLAKAPKARGGKSRSALLAEVGQTLENGSLYGLDGANAPKPGSDNDHGRVAKRSAVVALRFLVQLGLFLESAHSRSFLLELDGSELLVVAYALAALKASCLHEPAFLLSWSLHVVARAALGPGKLLIYAQLLTSLTSLRACRTKP